MEVAVKFIPKVYVRNLTEVPVEVLLESFLEVLPGVSLIFLVEVPFKISVAIPSQILPQTPLSVHGLDAPLRISS